VSDLGERLGLSEFDGTGLDVSVAVFDRIDAVEQELPQALRLFTRLLETARIQCA
jgi:hypothetical protein